MVQDALKIEREAFLLLPEILTELFDRPDPAAQQEVQPGDPDRRIDGTLEAYGRQWVFEVKSSSRPGIVAGAAQQLTDAPQDGFPVLVVPYMTKAGAEEAKRHGLNWIDLSGNADLREGDHLHISVRGNPNRYAQRGRPSSPFAPKSSRIARAMLIEPQRWWRQNVLAEATRLDDGHVSRIVRRLLDERLLEKREAEVRPLNPWLLLDAWNDEYRFKRHDVVLGHVSGTGIEVSRELHGRLREAETKHALTGLPAAWLYRSFARFRLNSLYVAGDPRQAAARIGLRLEERGANVQLIGPDDEGVFEGSESRERLPCVHPVQVYLDLNHLPERAPEAAEDLRLSLFDGAAR
jgi:hypothetical protein